MRCSKCKFFRYDESWDCHECELFSQGHRENEISDNRNGEEGCKYNLKTLEKISGELQEAWNKTIEAESKC